MDHHYIEDNHIVDRYLMGRLAEREQEDFEVHFLDCTDCCERLEYGDAFIKVIKDLDVNEFQFGIADKRWRRLAFAASVLLAPALVFSAWSTRELGQLRQEFQSVTPANAAVLVIPVLSTRGLDAEAANVIELTSKPQLLVLELEGLFADQTEHLVSVGLPDAAPIWQEHVLPDYRGLLVIGLSSTLFEQDTYQVTVSQSESRQEMLTFAFRVVAVAGHADEPTAGY